MKENLRYVCLLCYLFCGKIKIDNFMEGELKETEKAGYVPEGNGEYRELQGAEDLCWQRQMAYENFNCRR